MKIPKSFKILGQKIDVIFSEEPLIERNDAIGFASYRTNEIQLDTILKNRKEDILESTFWHEVVHFIFYYGVSFKPNDEWLHQHEGIVDSIGNLLHQVVNSFEY